MRPDPWGRTGRLISHMALAPAYWLLPILLWTLVVGGSLWWNWKGAESHSLEVASKQARQVGAMMEAMRLWNAAHGGVYVWQDEAMQPNPYLVHPERELDLADGRALTMVNPAFMTRGLIDIVREKAGLRVHLTSLDPINPGNQANLWETAMLEFLERENQHAETGSKAGLPWNDRSVERVELVRGTTPELRYMRALHVEQACMQCHQHQGYEVGDIRGGLSVTLPAAPMFAYERQQKASLIASHGLAWLLLTVVTIGVLSRLRHQIRSLQEINAQQDRLVEVRTGELRNEVAERQQAEARLRLLIDSSAEGILATNREGVCTLCNPVAARLLGYREASLVGKHLRDLIVHSDHQGEPRDIRECPITRAYRLGEEGGESDTVFWRADDSPLAVEYQAHPIRTSEGVTGSVITFRDITERKRMQEEVWRRAHYDALTGLPNRVLFRERLEQQLLQIRRRGEALAVCFVDLDGFKQVNDTLGHDAGDLVLREVGRRMRECLRASDTAARLGGDEFALILPGPRSLDDLERVLGRIIESLARPFDCQGREASIAGSVGVATIDGEEGISVDELLRRADLAMYQAKRAGGNAWRRYEPGEDPDKSKS
ncbi:diguanylate cyclase domain-containing protein [Billgrantia kenyensis]|uniref:Diguanylate cyclase n=1 Tax=Billgrantia kenyensis TaxID=321266 RepID=A0A7V9W1U3_9GAMM|nr:diguanylate cyclase [Halomonas kenyensis]MBA2779465.1 diguanylate cyclase [Halomonas kenyensis]MCG6662698.1 diguanylate cyclase [Halomonas kenyensis]